MSDAEHTPDASNMIPEWAKAAAHKVWFDLDLMDSGTDLEKNIIARALVAATAKERERCAARLDELSVSRRAKIGSKPNDKRTVVMGYDDLQEVAAKALDIAARALRALEPAIRKGDE